MHCPLVMVVITFCLKLVKLFFTLNVGVFGRGGLESLLVVTLTVFVFIVYTMTFEGLCLGGGGEN